MKTNRLSFALLALLALAFQPAHAQIVIDSDPPPFFPGENFTVTSTHEVGLEVGPFSESHSVEIELTGEDIRNFWGTLWGWITGGGNDGGGGDDGGGDDGGGNDDGGGTDTDTDSDNDNDSDNDSSSGGGSNTGQGDAAENDTSLADYVGVQGVRVTENRLVIRMNDPAIHSLTTNEPMQVPAIFLKDLGVTQTKYVPPGTYTRKGRNLVLPLKKRPKNR